MRELAWLWCVGLVAGCVPKSSEEPTPDAGAPAPDSGADSAGADSGCEPTDEVCDEADNDCDGLVDEEVAETWYPDEDGDHYGSEGGASVVSCEPPDGYISLRWDCDDADPSINPSQDERCDGIDDDCDGRVDEDAAIDAGTWYADDDGDGYGADAAAVVACDPPAGASAAGADCDDADAAVHPAADETCDGIDDDCDGDVDEPSAVDAAAWYRDGDGDTYGDAAITTAACAAPAGYVGVSTDCDDFRPAVHPAATEVCDGLDNDCDGSINESGAVGEATFYRDEDGDGYGGTALTVAACAAPAGYAANDDDCDDGDAGLSPAVAELCDGVDQDCDGDVDEGALVTFSADADGDGYGGDGAPVASCAAPAGYAAVGDCDDGDAAVSPGVAEDCADGADQDCDGLLDCEDGDCATFAACVEVNCADGVDNDLNGEQDCDDSDCWGVSACPAVVSSRVLGASRLWVERQSWNGVFEVGTTFSLDRESCSLVASARGSDFSSVSGTARIWQSSAVATCSWTAGWASRWQRRDWSWPGAFPCETWSSSGLSRGSVALSAGCPLTGSAWLPQRLTLSADGHALLAAGLPWYQWGPDAAWGYFTYDLHIGGAGHTASGKYWSSDGHWEMGKSSYVSVYGGSSYTTPLP